MGKQKQRLALAFVLALAGLYSGCSEPTPQPFDPQRWKSGGKSVRGSMVRDLQKRRVLEGKSKAEVEQLLGKPDAELNEQVWGYEVVTIPRCNFWVCRMEVGFDNETGKAIGDVAVSD